MNTIFIIYIIGVVFNLIVVKKIIIIPTDEYDGSMAAFVTAVILLPWIFLMYFLRVIFIGGSWISWIFLGIIKILEHYDK
jgi:hypothetical protein